MTKGPDRGVHVRACSYVGEEEGDLVEGITAW